MDFNGLQISPENGAELMILLGLSHYDLDDGRKFNMVKDITNYFKDSPNLRNEILKLTAKTYGQDKLEKVWTYVALQNEKAAKIQQLDPSQFAEDIEEQIKTGILTQDNIKRIKKDIQTYDNQMAQTRQANDEVEEINKNAVEQLMAKPKTIDILQKTKELLSEVEVINKELSLYE